MSFGTGGFFGSGGKESETTTSASTKTQDNRVGIEGGAAGPIVSGESQMALPAAANIQLGNQSSKNHVELYRGAEITMGMDPNQVGGIVDTVLTSSSRQYDQLAGLGQSLSSGIEKQSSQLADIVKATKAPEASQLSTLAPFIIVAAVFYFLSK